ncbi:MAG: tRNA epoxyqueuosine(34) reductase QueG [Gemmatimonadetes bacterium]|nr:tRNA epoxyqueuosine(34) reductase QueG [Gemmatimonadota bacterium]
MSLTTQIRRKARDLGFTAIGFTPATPLAGAQFYAHWVAMGYAGQMHYLEKYLDKREDPRKLVPGARTAICLGMDYYQPSPETEPLHGQIACYARGDDYHEVIKKRLAELWEFMLKTAGADTQGRYFVDTAPVLERELAQRAGLGWWGKNTCLIDKRRGSYFFLAEIITDLELDYDEPAPDHCGTCTRCLDACPTDAFPEPYVLDATRCISYLSIELKESIPRDLRQGMGNWIFGCDICQQVCPWNRKPEPAPEPSYKSRPTLDNPSLLDLIQLDHDAFNDLFRRNPAKRPKRKGFLRNVAVALGNSGTQEAIPVLIPALDDEEPLVRAHVAWALGQLGGSEAKEALVRRLTTEEEAEVRVELEEALTIFQKSS